MNCSHKRIDENWMPGVALVCLDCGATKDVPDSGDWIDEVDLYRQMYNALCLEPKSFVLHIACQEQREFLQLGIERHLPYTTDLSSEYESRWGREE